MSVSYDRSRAAWVSVSGCGGSGKVRRLSQSGECASSHRGPCRRALPLPGRGIHSRPSIYTRADRQPRRRSSQPHARFRRHPHPPGARPCVDARRRPRGANAHHRRAPRAPSNGHARRGRRRGRPGLRGLRGLATGAGAPPRRARSLLGEELRREKEALGALVTLEAGKIVQEGLGEVQEMIDICDFAVGLSRQLYGLTIASERPGHRMFETWHPLGADRRHHRVQLPGRRVELERRARAGRAATRSSGSRRRSRRSPRSRAGRSVERAAERFGDAPEGLVEVVVGATRRASSSTTRGCRSSPRPARPRMGRTIAPRIAAPARPVGARARRQQRR